MMQDLLLCCLWFPVKQYRIHAHFSTQQKWQIDRMQKKYHDTIERLWYCFAKEAHAADDNDMIISFATCCDKFEWPHSKKNLSVLTPALSFVSLQLIGRNSDGWA